MSSESIFISYANKDSQFANKLARSLQQAGAQVWIESIHGGDDDDITANAIKSAKLMLIITSEHALKDESLKQEKDYARENKVDRWLVKIEPCDTDSKMRWKSLPVIDLSKDKTAGMNELMERLGLTSSQEVVPDSTQVVENVEKVEEVEKVEDISATESQQAVPAEEDSTADTRESVDLENKSPELERKERLLVTNEEFDMIRSILKRQIRSSWVLVGVFVAALIGIAFLIYMNQDYFQELLAKTDDSDTQKDIDWYSSWLLRIVPGIGNILPGAFGFLSFKKISENKKRISLVDKLERKRDRFNNFLESTSESEIMALEEELENLVNL